MLPLRVALPALVSAFLLILYAPAICPGVELNYFAAATNPFDSADPVGSRWTELYPNLDDDPYTILDWKDCGDDVLSLSDTVSMERSGAGASCHQVVDVTITLEVKTSPADLSVGFWNWDWTNGGGDPCVQPVGTWWQELQPEFGSPHNITAWTDNGSGVLDSSDLITIGGDGEYFVERVCTGMVTEPVGECPIDVSTWGEIKSLYR